VQQTESPKAKAHLHKGASRSFTEAESLCSCIYFYNMLPGISPLTLQTNTNVLSLDKTGENRVIVRMLRRQASDCGADKIQFRGQIIFSRYAYCILSVKETGQ